MSTHKLYLDVCCYNRPFDDQTQVSIRLETEAKLHIQSNIKSYRYLLIWSYMLMLDLENNENPYDEKRNTIIPWKDIAVEYCSSSDEILATGQKIMNHGIKAKDALHLACAIKSGSDYFITTDKGLMKKNIENIIIKNPIDFVREMESSYEIR